MLESEILERLAEGEAVLTGLHFVYTAGDHGTAYINMRAVAHQTDFLEELGEDLSEVLKEYNVDIVVGPETLGRDLARFTASWLSVESAWCDIVEVDGVKQAVFSPKLNFARLFPGKRVAVVDDLLTTGGSIRLTVEAVQAAGGEVVVAAAVVRRTPDITAEKCGAPELVVLAEVQGFEKFTEEECAAHGPCSRQVPVVARPGHGWKWLEEHPDYPGTT